MVLAVSAANLDVRHTKRICMKYFIDSKLVSHGINAPWVTIYEVVREKRRVVVCETLNKRYASMICKALNKTDA